MSCSQQEDPIGQHEPLWRLQLKIPKTLFDTTDSVAQHMLLLAVNWVAGTVWQNLLS